MSDRETLKEARQRQLWSDLPVPEQPTDGLLARAFAWLYGRTCTAGAATARERTLLEQLTTERERRRAAEVDQQTLADQLHVARLNCEQLTALVEHCNQRLLAQVAITERLAGAVKPVR